MIFSASKVFKYLKYKVIQPHGKGHGIHSPFLFDFVTEVLCKKTRNNHDLRTIQAIHRDLLRNKKLILVNDNGAGSSKMKGNHRQISAIARHSATNYKYGRLLYNLVDHYKPAIIIELGSCLGLGTLYLASANDKSKVHTVEGSETLGEIAKQTYQQSGLTNIYLHLGTFDNILPSLLKDTNGFDLVYVDGNHTKEATIRYFHMLIPYAQSHSIIIFDDIRWSQEMEMAWKEICNDKNVKLSVDLFNLGIVFFNELLIKQRFEIYY